MTNQRAAVEAMVAEILTGKRDLVETFLVFAATQRAEERDVAAMHCPGCRCFEASNAEIIRAREGPG